MTIDPSASPPPALHRVGLKLEPLLSPGLVLECSTGEPVSELLPEEVVATHSWTPHRRAQFTLGRQCARRGLRRLGRDVSPILFDIHGAPQWPNGVVGSISHKRQNCVAVLGGSSDFASVGVDLELDGPEKAEDQLVQMVCPTGAERDQAQALREQLRSPGTLFLSAKEAFFKLQFPTTGRRLDWSDVQVAIGTNTFVVGRSAAVDRSLEGLFVVEAGWIITVIWDKEP